METTQTRWRQQRKQGRNQTEHKGERPDIKGETKDTKEANEVGENNTTVESKTWRTQINWRENKKIFENTKTTQKNTKDNPVNTGP